MIVTQIIEKAPYGAACNNCGKCCEDQICILGKHLFLEEDGPCPALGYMMDGQSYCGLVKNPRQFAPVRTAIHGPSVMKAAARLLIASHLGCDAQLDGEPANDIFREKLRRLAAQLRDSGMVARALLIWAPK